MAVRFFIFILCSGPLLMLVAGFLRISSCLGRCSVCLVLPSDGEDLSQGLAQKVWTLTLAVFIVLHVSAAS